VFIDPYTAALHEVEERERERKRLQAKARREQKKLLLAQTPEVPIGTVYQLEVHGEILSAVRMTQKSKWVNPEARKYLNYLARVRSDVSLVALIHKLTMLVDQEFSLAVSFFIDPSRLYVKDTKNLYWGIEDALEGILYENDRYNMHISSSKESCERSKEKAFILLEVLSLRGRNANRSEKEKV